MTDSILFSLLLSRELEALALIIVYADKYSPNKRITLQEKTSRHI